jgi:hypothetical protein
MRHKATSGKPAERACDLRFGPIGIGSVAASVSQASFFSASPVNFNPAVTHIFNPAVTHDGENPWNFGEQQVHDAGSAIVNRFTR